MKAPFEVGDIVKGVTGDGQGKRGIVLFSYDRMLTLRGEDGVAFDASAHDFVVDPRPSNRLRVLSAHELRYINEKEKNPKKGITQLQLNHLIEWFIRDMDELGGPYTREDIEYLQSYEGSGGQGSKGATGQGLLYEYFTPDYICALMWQLAHKYGYDGGAVLEPACGTGRFIKHAPDKSKVVAFETSKISARIAEVTYPEAEIHRAYFEAAFMQAPRYTTRLSKFTTWLKQAPFSLVIGNPPYGKHKNKYSSFFKHPPIPQLEMFFMYYGLQVLKPGGLLVFITSSNFLRTGATYEYTKKEMEKIADLVDAYRLPPVFKTSDVPTDILILRRK